MDLPLFLTELTASLCQNGIQLIDLEPSSIAIVFKQTLSDIIRKILRINLLKNVTKKNKNSETSCFTFDVVKEYDVV